MTRLTDADLLVYLDGGADPELITRIEGSSDEQQRASELSRLQNRLRTRLFRANCPSALIIGEYHQALLPPQEAAQVRQHLALCPHCQAERAHLQEFLAEPPGLLERAHQVVAKLISSPGSFRQTARLGVRGGDEPFLYSAGAVNVVFNIQVDSRRPERKTLAGLVLGKSAQGWEVHLLRGGDVIAKTTIDELGNFILGDLSAGDYEVRLYSADEAILISPLQLE